MRVAVIVNSLRFGGAEIQTVELANRLAARGCKMLLMSMDSVTAIRERVHPEIEVAVIDKKAYLDFKALGRIIALLKEFKPRHLLTVNSYSALYGYLASFFTRRSFKMVSIQHTTLFQGMVDAIQNSYYTPIINRMDRIVFVSKNQREHWIKNYRIKSQKSLVIYNGIDMDRFTEFQGDRQAVRAGLGFSPEDIVIGINANFRPEKKHEDMVDALEMLLKQGYPVRLLFIGDGERRSFIEKYIASKGLEKYAAITGFVQDVRPWLSCVDISALTSVAVETLSMAIIESMAMGKAIVLSDIGGASELVEPGVNGFLYPAGNVERLAEVLKKVINGRLFEDMGRKSLEKAKRLFDGRDMADRYMDMLKGG